MLFAIVMSLSVLRAVAGTETANYLIKLLNNEQEKKSTAVYLV